MLNLLRAFCETQRLLPTQWEKIRVSAQFAPSVSSAFGFASEAAWRNSANGKGRSIARAGAEAGGVLRAVRLGPTGCADSLETGGGKRLISPPASPTGKQSSSLR